LPILTGLGQLPRLHSVDILIRLGHDFPNQLQSLPVLTFLRMSPISLDNCSISPDTLLAKFLQGKCQNSAMIILEHHIDDPADQVAEAVGKVRRVNFVKMFQTVFPVVVEAAPGEKIIPMLEATQ